MAPEAGHVLELNWQDPVSVFQAFKHDPGTVWLDSQGEGPRARFSYLCVSPFEMHDQGSGFAILDNFLHRFSGLAIDAPVPFAGGAAGFLAYESAAQLENISRHASAGIPDHFIGFYDLVFAWDHLQNRFWLISTGLPETDPAARAALAAARQAQILSHKLPLPLAGEATGLPRSCGKGEGSRPAKDHPLPNLLWHQEIPRALHEARVAQAIAYIRAGDIFQANITAGFSARIPENLSPADIHLALRASNRAPYGAFLAYGKHVAIASVSPERFVGVSQGGSIEARPIKGTRARSRHPQVDAALADELLNSVKDRAENLMIVDLLRNDIGRVAQFGSIRVPELARLETFPHIHHLVSCVRGQLRPGATAADLLRVCFPGGSITGAPKIRAMQIIHDIEQIARGPYCGSIFWLGADGAMDSSILIRTATITQNTIRIAAGGGIVADSDPAGEYEEMMLKARPLLTALGTPPE